MILSECKSNDIESCLASLLFTDQVLLKSVVVEVKRCGKCQLPSKTSTCNRESTVHVMELKFETRSFVR